jgi:hypothetical protein
LKKEGGFLDGLVYYQLVVNGEPFRDDFGVSSQYLVLSEAAFSLVNTANVPELQNYEEGSSLDLLPDL